MATQYIEKEGGYSAAISELIEKGGQLYSGDDQDGCTTIVRGCYVTRFWTANSAKKGKLIEACKAFGYEPYGMTGGSLCRKIIDDILELPYKHSRYAECYRQIALSGSHWHYTYLKQGDHGRTIEYDLTSAYMTQYLRLPSMILLGKDTFADDNGAMERLRDIMPLFPKWLRVQFLGVLASHNRTTTIREDKDGKWVIKKVITPSITYGGAFNSAHRAILRVFKIMKHIHSLSGEYCKRVHTDSFLLSQSTPREILLNIFNYLEDNNQDIAIKAIGRSCFWELNEGVIGKKIVGCKPMVQSRMKMENFKQVLKPVNDDCIRTWGDIIADIEKGMNDRKTIPISYEQCKVEWNKAPQNSDWF